VDNYIIDSRNDKEFQEIIKELIENETVQSMNNYLQHCKTTCYDHCYRVSYLCYKFCKKHNLDYKSAARAGMLHDLFLYDWRKKAETGRKGLHAYTHGATACDNASKLFDLSEKEKDMIRNHMFPVTVYPPKSVEGFILTIVDKYCTMAEFNQYICERYSMQSLIINYVINKFGLMI